MAHYSSIKIKNRKEKLKLGKIHEIFLYVFVTIYFLFFSIICVRKYLSFQYLDWDLAIYTNIMWNIVHGLPYSSLFGIHFLQDHASFIAYPVALLYFIFRHPITLLILQTLAIALTAIPIYLVARDHLDSFLAAAIVLCYLLFPAVHYANLYEFYFETLSLPFLAFAFYFLTKKKVIPFFLMCILACACKENIPIIVAAMGVFALFRRDDKILGIVAIVLGAIWTLFDLKVLPLLLSQWTGHEIKGLGATAAFEQFLFPKYGKSLGEIFFYILVHPFGVAKDFLLNGIKGGLFLHLLGPLLFLPLLGLDVLLVVAPHVLIRLLGQNINEHTIFFHSAAPIIPFVFFALIVALQRLFKKWPALWMFKKILVIFLIVADIGFASWIWETRPNLARFRLTGRDFVREGFVRAIPQDASVAASLPFLSHLANREHVSSPHMFFGRSFMGLDKKKTPPHWDFILLDAQDPVMIGSHYESGGLFDPKLYDYLQTERFGLVKAKNDIFLLKKGHEAKERLFEPITDQSIGDLKPVLLVGDSLALLKQESELLVEDQVLLKLTFYWQKLNDDREDFNLVFFMDQGGYDTVCGSHLLGYALFPPSLWKKNDIVKETLWLVLPPLLREGDHKLSVMFVGADNGQKKEIKAENAFLVNRYGKYKLWSLEV